MASSSVLSYSYVWMAICLFNYSHKCIVGNGNTHRFHYFMPSYHYALCLIVRNLNTIAHQRKEDACFSLFASTVFQEWHCAPVPHPNCRCGKQVRLSSGNWTHRHKNRSPSEHISVLCILSGHRILYTALIAARSVGSITTNSSTSSGSLIYISATLSGMMILPDSVFVMIPLFIFIPLIYW